MQRRDLANALIASTTAAIILSEKAQAQTCTAPCYAQTPAELAASITPSNYAYSPSPRYNMQRYGISPNGVDNTAIVQKVFNMVKVTGGTMEFPYGNWAFYLDISGSNLPVVIEGNGSTFQPYTSTPTNSCVVYANNSAGSNQFNSSNVQFRNCNFTARKYGSSSSGDVHYCVEFNGTNAVFYGCTFNYGSVAAFYAFYGQYIEFWSCEFGAVTASSTSAGCILDSAGLTASSNEVLFSRCKFFTCSNGLIIKGGQLTRLEQCTLQGMPAGGSGALVITSDSTGSFSGGTVVRDCWFEVNAVPHITGPGAYSTLITGCMFWPTGGTSEITFGTSAIPAPCYDLKFIDNSWPGGGTVSIVHPSGNADVAQLTWRGNAIGSQGPMVPTTLSLAHSGATYVDLSLTGSFVGTLTGCSGTAPTATISYVVEGGKVQMQMPSLTGTSDSTTCTITGMPAVIYPVYPNTRYGVGITENDGVIVLGMISVSYSGVITLYNGTSPTFTAAGTKGSQPCLFEYSLF